MFELIEDESAINFHISFGEYVELQSIYDKYAKLYSELCSAGSIQDVLAGKRLIGSFDGRLEGSQIDAEVNKLLSDISLSKVMSQHGRVLKNDIDHRCLELEKEVVLQDQVKNESMQMIDAAKKRYTRAVVKNDMQGLNEIELEIEQYEKNMRLAIIRQPLYQKAKESLIYLCKPLDMMIDKAVRNVSVDKYSSEKKAYLAQVKKDFAPDFLRERKKWIAFTKKEEFSGIRSGFYDNEREDAEMDKEIWLMLTGKS